MNGPRKCTPPANRGESYRRPHRAGDACHIGGSHPAVREPVAVGLDEFEERFHLVEPRSPADLACPVVPHDVSGGVQLREVYVDVFDRDPGTAPCFVGENVVDAYRHSRVVSGQSSQEPASGPRFETLEQRLPAILARHELCHPRCCAGHCGGYRRRQSRRASDNCAGRTPAASHRPTGVLVPVRYARPRCLRPLAVFVSYHRRFGLRPGAAKTRNTVYDAATGGCQ